jgi:hypothetical protein
MIIIMDIMHHSLRVADAWQPQDVEARGDLTQKPPSATVFLTAQGSVPHP